MLQIGRDDPGHGVLADERSRGAAARPAGRTDGSIKSMKKMLRVLECFSASERRLAPSEIARRAGLPRATAHRIVQTLRQIGFLDQDRERDEYRLGLKLFELGNIVVGRTDLHRAAAPIAAALAQVTGDVVQLALLDGAQIVIVHRFLPERVPAELGALADVAPAHCTASGKVLLTFQPEAVLRRIFAGGLARMTEATRTDEAELRADFQAVRECGHAVDRGESHAAWHCVAAPIRHASGQVIAGLSICGPAARMSQDRLTALAALVRENAATIARRLAG